MKNRRFQLMKAILFFLLVIGISLAVQLFVTQRIGKDELPLDDGWTVTDADGVTENADLTLLHFKDLKKGDQITFERVLMKSPYVQPILNIQSNYSAVYVYLDGEQIYESGTHYLKQNQLIGNGYHWISLPADIEGRTLRIVYDIGEDNAFTSLHKIMLQESLRVYSGLVCRQLLTALICCCLFAVGVICVFCILLSSFKDRRLRMLLWLGCFALSIGMWLFCNSRLIEGFTQNLHLICHLEYLSMYASSVTILLFVSSFFKRKKEKRLFRGFALGFLALGTVLTILSVNNIVHYPKTVLLFHIAMLVVIVVLIFCLYKEAGRHNKADQSFLYGMLCFFLSVILELVRYRYNKICLPVYMLQQSVIPVGAMIFILAMFGSFFYRMMERVVEEMERKKLYEMAYRDALTNIPNRAWCEKIMREYEQGKKPISIVTMDLNLFKQVNDTFGHAAGDSLLMRFAMLLETHFQQRGCVGRMGGDEFVVIMDYIQPEQVQELMQSFLQRLRTENEKKQYAYEISVSYGFAGDSTGQNQTPWQVYEQADQRMYDNKRAGRL